MVGVMAREAVLGRFVIIRRHKQKRVGAHFLRALRKLYAVARVVRARARDNRNAFVYFIDHELNYFKLLVVRQGGGFAGRSANYNGVGFVFDLKLDKLG